MFKKRSYTKELLDGDKIPDNDLYRNLKELDAINNLLGGYNITFKALQKILLYKKEFTIVDIGCGGGDTIKRINRWAKQKNFPVKLVGVDLKQVCINYSIENNKDTTNEFICDDYRNVTQHIKNIDILHACLFCHHLTNEEIIALIQFAESNKITLIINDLQRNPIAYYAIKILTQLFSKSYLVKNDAPLSVLRGFKRKELYQLLKQSGAKRYTINYRWAFRYEVIVYND